MYLQEILEVAIGLVFMWLIISVAAMSIQEWIANLLQWRSNDMEIVIRRMLTGENVRANKAVEDAFQNLGDLLYEHPLIKTLSKDSNWFEKTWVKFLNLFHKKSTKIVAGHPSYIPSSKFSLALFDIVMNAGTDKSPIHLALKQLDQAFETANTELAAIKKPNLETIFGEVLKQALNDVKSLAGTPLGDNAIDSIKFRIESLAKQYPEATPITDILVPQISQYYQKIAAEKQMTISDANTDAEVMKRLRISILALGATNPELMKSLRSLVTGVEGYAADKEKSLAVARKNVETWFDDAMTRLSGWYKRKAQLTALIIGLFLAILLNVDSIVVATSLWREPTLRQIIVAQAEAYAQQNETLPQSSDGTTTPTPPKTVEELQADLSALNIPFGWETEAYFVAAGETCQVIPVSKNAVWGVWSKSACKRVSNAPVDSTGWLSKIAGILITAMAAAQGAPFWFDILKKLVNVRSSGANPAEEKPKG
ncbi:MAG: hypothetical protein FD146_747 [Anaerolineaceae bacterium]|nr:MAG: hypothetical protein FD146_747 [Anaerolineaceae bacterium]